DSGVAHRDVYAAQACNGFLNRGSDAGGVRDIQFDADGFAACLGLQLIDQTLQLGLAGSQVGDGDGGALRGERGCNGAAQSTAATRDESDFALEVCHATMMPAWRQARAGVGTTA